LIEKLDVSADLTKMLAEFYLRRIRQSEAQPQAAGS